jgi:hypothetical protein
MPAIAVPSIREAVAATDPEESGGRWWVLAFSLPMQPAYARVKVWRRLQAVGAVSLAKNALYVLPAREATLEDFEWIVREVRATGGDAVILDARVIAGYRDADVEALFRQARDAEYEALAEEARALLGALDRKRNAPEPAEAAAQLARLRERCKAIEARDFFASTGRGRVEALLRTLDGRVSSRSAGDAQPPDPSVPIGRGRVWVTRAGVHVDRMASAWLIRRMLDPEARFRFVKARQYRPQPGELRFDMFDGEFTHDGDRCTFEVLLDRVAADPALRAIGEIIHDLDLKESKYGRPETAGIGQVLDGIARGSENDEERLRRSADILEELYRSFSRARR